MPRADKTEWAVVNVLQEEDLRRRCTLAKGHGFAVRGADTGVVSCLGAVSAKENRCPRIL